MGFLTKTEREKYEGYVKRDYEVAPGAKRTAGQALALIADSLVDVTNQLKELNRQLMLQSLRRKL
jgi:hypothetical protein